MTEISVDIIFLLFCKLPVKALLRFRCVSKQFQSLIDSPYFICRHLQYQTSTYPKLIIQNSGKPKPIFLDMNSIDNRINFEYPLCVKCVDWICSCNGLLAISYYNDNPPYYVDNRPHIILLNPSTKKANLLPRCDSLVGGFSVGFCYDAAADYKLVTVLRRGRGFVYSLKADSWRRIEVPSKFNPRGSGISIENNNTLCWWNYSGDHNEYLGLVGYNVMEDKFSELPIPDEIRRIKSQIINLEGCLGLISGSGLNLMSYTCSYDLWQMKEYGVKNSWIKLYSEILKVPSVVTFDFLLSEVFVPSEHGDKIFVFFYTGLVLQYDLKTRKSDSFEIDKFSPNMKCPWKLLYVESLVSPYVNG